MKFREGDIVRHLCSRRGVRVVGVEEFTVDRYAVNGELRNTDPGIVADIVHLDDGSTWISDALELVRRPTSIGQWFLRGWYWVRANIGGVA